MRKHGDILRMTYAEGPKALQWRTGDVVFWIDGVERRFKSPVHGELLACVAHSAPRTMSVEEIFEGLRQRVAVGSPLNLEATVHKYVHGLRQDLAAAGLRIEVLRNVRSVGYRLGDGWRVDRPDDSASLMTTELVEIQSLIERCVAHVNARPVVTNKGGLSYLDCDPELVKENMVLLDRIGWQLIHNLSEPEFVPDVLDIKRDLTALLSYALFWRVGHRLSEDEWKQDYRAEIQKTRRDIEMRIGRLQENIRALRPQPTPAEAEPRLEAGPSRPARSAPGPSPR